MFKKDMTPIGVHKKGTLHSSPNKGSAQRHLPASAAGGVPNMQSYAKATPMAQSDQPAPAPDGLGSGSFPGIATG
jgi:hypothetical protein